jgi:hypothetical protein
MKNKIKGYLNWGTAGQNTYNNRITLRKYISKWDLSIDILGRIVNTQLR